MPAQKTLNKITQSTQIKAPQITQILLLIPLQ